MNNPSIGSPLFFDPVNYATASSITPSTTINGSLGDDYVIYIFLAIAFTSFVFGIAVFCFIKNYSHPLPLFSTNNKANAIFKFLPKSKEPTFGENFFYDNDYIDETDGFPNRNNKPLDRSDIAPLLNGTIVVDDCFSIDTRVPSGCELVLCVPIDNNLNTRKIIRNIFGNKIFEMEYFKLETPEKLPFSIEKNEYHSFNIDTDSQYSLTYYEVTNDTEDNELLVEYIEGYYIYACTDDEELLSKNAEKIIEGKSLNEKSKVLFSKLIKVKMNKDSDKNIELWLIEKLLNDDESTSVYTSVSKKSMHTKLTKKTTNDSFFNNINLDKYFGKIEFINDNNIVNVYKFNGLLDNNKVVEKKIIFLEKEFITQHIFIATPKNKNFEENSQLLTHSIKETYSRSSYESNTLLLVSKSGSFPNRLHKDNGALSNSSYQIIVGENCDCSLILFANILFDYYI